MLSALKSLVIAVVLLLSADAVANDSAFRKAMMDRARGVAAQAAESNWIGLRTY